MTNTDQPIAYTVDRALEALGIGRTKFYEEIKAGRLKAKKVGKRTLVTHVMEKSAMTDSYHTYQNNQDGSPDFSMELSLAIRAQYSAANAAPGPRIKKELLANAARLEALQRSFGIQAKLKNVSDRMVNNAESPAHV